MTGPLDVGALAALPVSRSSLDRLAARRRDAGLVEELLLDDSGTRVVLVGDSRVRCVDGSPRLCTPAQARESGAPLAEGYLLGRHEETTYLAVHAEADGAQESWLSLRHLPALDPLKAELVVTAIALDTWHTSNPYSPRTGARTVVTQAGWSRTCPLDGSEHFPRTDPAVIVLVRDDDNRVLLGHRKDWPAGRYSTLAGFVEAGESAEAAVLREVEEEAAVRLDPARLHALGSQPWPFPHSLMLGYHAYIEADSPPAAPDLEEIDEVRWFTRASMAAAIEDRTVLIPPSLSIARRLLEHWYGSALPPTTF